MNLKLDRTAFYMGTHEQTEQYHAECQSEMPEEKLRNAIKQHSFSG